MKSIPLSKGYEALIDDDDFDFINQWKWHYVTGRGYARRTQTKPVKKDIYMHRLIMNCPEGMEVDHINGNKLDNRKENLRVVTHAQNMKNSKRRKDSTTGYKGVMIDKRCKDNIYYAQINVNGKNIYGKYCATPEEAARSYNDLAVKHYGEFAKLNEDVIRHYTT